MFNNCGCTAGSQNRDIFVAIRDENTTKMRNNFALSAPPCKFPSVSVNYLLRYRIMKVP